VHPGIVICPDILNSIHDKRVEGGKQLLKVFPDIMVFLSRASDNGRRKDGIAPVINAVDLKNGKGMSQRIISVMVPKGSFVTPHFGRDAAY